MRRLLSCLPIDSVTGSIYTGRDTPAVIEVDHQETEGETEQLVQVDGVSELQPLRIFLSKWNLGENPPNLFTNNVDNNHSFDLSLCLV